jgi:CTP:molybdopterin cytidylyltransferase MocA
VTARLTGIVVAAGRGRRMGGSKARLVVSGVTLLERHVLGLFEAGCAEVLAVVHPDDASFARTLPGGARVLAASTESQWESLTAALDTLDQPTTLVITPVDMLPVTPHTLALLIAAVSGEVRAATPIYRGRGGHPVVVRSELLALPGESLRDRLTSAGARRARIAVDDPTVLTDLDTPADVASVL